ncbi:MAG: amidase [Chloroflexi bacterium]|nr:amidase [Chloroflexota bacterium]MCI0787677.1 amidase [Chloroflexota bacterium]MCI0793752.1 amidase [Chloroflexota bacterium]MCI0797462.1 amidase [Chloroflexota bacterium]MCI0825798.1 amidase [Chloroflexota bacterium]
MADLSQEQMLEMARIAGLRIPDEDVEHLTFRLNALLEASQVLDQYPLDELKALPSLAHPFELPSHQREHRPAPPLTVETDAPLAYKPITELSHLIRTRQLSPVELTDLYLQRIGQFDGDLKSYITVLPEIARQEAREAERAVAEGSELGLLHGIPLAYKDEFYTKGVRTTCGSLILSEFVPDYDATAVGKLHEAGAVMLGKLNMTEWATPLTLEFPYGQPRNPWNLEHDAGGSSTGSGIATAAALCAGALGEDTGGSIRRPAANNSCVGLRPSWGRVSMHGVIPAVWSQDTAGPLVRTVADCALLMNVIAGYDPNDPITANLPVPDYTAVLDGNIRGMRVGVVKETMEAAHLHPEVKAAVEEALRRFEGLGATVEEVSIPTITLSGVISGAGGSDRTALQWKHLMQSPDRYDAAARRFNLLPGLLPAALYQRALQLRNLLRGQILEACQRYDVLLSPYQATPPPRIQDTKRPLASKEQALNEIWNFSFSNAAPFAGVPAISVPCGFTQDGLPLGLQIMAKRFDEEAVFRAAHAYEQDTPWHTMRPPVGDQ